jgi:integrase
MTPRAPRSRCRADPLVAAAPDPLLAAIGLRAGDRVRFRRRDGERWKDATVVRRETDGSLGVRDTKGALRAIPLDRVEARTEGPRGGVVWEPVPELAARTEQLGLF